MGQTEETHEQLIACSSVEAVALLVCEESGSRMGKWLILVPSGSNYRRIGITLLPSIAGNGGESFEEKDLLGGDHEFLRGTDLEFTARAVTRTLVLE